MLLIHAGRRGGRLLRRMDKAVEDARGCLSLAKEDTLSFVSVSATTAGRLGGFREEKKGPRLSSLRSKVSAE